jgi:indole-3-glycerol phosphate synthase
MKILDKIVAEKEREVASLPKREIGIVAGIRDFAGALRKPRRGSVALIAEVKKASPSAGVICADFDPVRVAREYEAAGADCLSVLTDGKFFQGSLEYLRQIREAVKLPLLRKDFIVDERQISESIDHGADAILLIVRILDDARLKRFHKLATGAGLAVLVETHDEREMDRALAIGATLIGINNRNLDNFMVDLSVTGRLAERVSNGVTLVAESGIHSRSDVEALEKSGAKAILVGESLMRNPAGIAAKVSELLGHA